VLLAAALVCALATPVAAMASGAAAAGAPRWLLSTGALYAASTIGSTAVATPGKPELKIAHPDTMRSTQYSEPPKTAVDAGTVLDPEGRVRSEQPALHTSNAV
jgi:hypothetical protein